MTLRIASLCSGVGCLDLAVKSVVDAELAWYAQYEPPDKNGREDTRQYAARVMAHHYPGVPNLGDITAIDYAGVEPVDIVTAGFPCTDVSLAGLRLGLMPGTRSGIWTHVARAIGALRPSLVLIENVRSLTSARSHCDLEHCPRCMGEAPDGDPVLALRALGTVLGDLADLGFDAEWEVVRASDVGGVHRRERVFILAWPADAAGLGRERGGSARGRRPGPADGRLAVGVPSVALGAAPNTEGDGRDPRRTGPARLVRGPDAALGGCATAPDAQGTRLEGVGPEPARGGSEPRTGTTADTDRDAQCPQRDGEPARSETDDSRHRVDPSGRFLGWGPYAAAIARWEIVMGRPAPRPVDDRGRLSARFTEWMMGLPDGWVTAVPDIPRNAQLKGLGNGVVWQQGAHAARILLARSGILAADRDEVRVA